MTGVDSSSSSSDVRPMLRDFGILKRKQFCIKEAAIFYDFLFSIQGAVRLSETGDYGLLSSRIQM